MTKRKRCIRWITHRMKDKIFKASFILKNYSSALVLSHGKKQMVREQSSIQFHGLLWNPHSFELSIKYKLIHLPSTQDCLHKQNKKIYSINHYLLGCRQDMLQVPARVQVQLRPLQDTALIFGMPYIFASVSTPFAHF